MAAGRQPPEDKPCSRAGRRRGLGLAGFWNARGLFEEAGDEDCGDAEGGDVAEKEDYCGDEEMIELGVL